jgi:uncharacterized protein GlcG (DUF336 family)
LIHFNHQTTAYFKLVEIARRLQDIFHLSAMGRIVMKEILACCAALLCVAMSAANADETKEKSAAFPGDLGRPFDGLPLPTGPTRRPPWPSRPPPARGPGVELALQAAQEAVAACAGSHVGVAIIDSAGTPKLYYVPDGTAGFHAYTGFRKAYTALTFKMPTSQLGALSKTDAVVAAKITADTNLLSFAGGVPIKVGDEVIGAIGVSGAEPSTIDEKCANAGLEKIKDHLK